MEKNLQKPYLTNYNLLTAQDLWQAQILLIILPKKFIKCRHGHDEKMRNVRNCECCLKYMNVKEDLILYKRLCCYRNYQKSVMKTSGRYLLIYTSFLAIISVNLFCCYEKVFTHLNKRMIGRNLMKHHYLRKKIFTVNITWIILMMQITLAENLESF